MALNLYLEEKGTVSRGRGAFFAGKAAEIARMVALSEGIEAIKSRRGISRLFWP